MNLQQLTLLQGFALQRDLIDQPVTTVINLLNKEKQDNELTNHQMWVCIGYSIVEELQSGIQFGKYEKMFHKYCSDFVSGVA